MKKLGYLLMVIAACKGGDKDKGDEGKSKTASGKAGPCEISASKPADLVSGKGPQLIAPFDKLSLGMSRADVAKACPKFFEGEDGKKTGDFYVGEIVGQFGETYAQGRLNFVKDKLDSVELALPPDIEAGLTAAWGAPKVSSGPKPAHAWFDETKLVRAILEPVSYDNRRELTISTYVPLAAFIDPDDKTIAWKPELVLGKLPADVAKQFPQYLKVDTTSAAVKAQTDEMMKDLKKEVEAMGVDTSHDADLPEFELPATPYANARSTQMILHTSDKTVRTYGVWFRTNSLTPEYGWPTQSADIIKKLDEVYGPHKTVKETLGERKMWFDAKRGVRLSTRVEKPEELDLSYSLYMPLPKLFGDKGSVWGFEKAERPLIGATPDEIKAAYKDHAIKHDEVNNTITMSMPPTDYDGESSRTTILMFVRGGKVEEWRFNIPFDNIDTAKAEYEAALAAKFGAPKKAPRDHFIYGKKPTVDVQFSDITHDMNVEVAK